MHFQNHSNPPPRAGGIGTDDDYVLMQGIARQDPAALARFYDRHSSIVYTLCLKILKDPGLAEDVMVDVFQELWAKSDRFNAGRGAPIAYLLTLTRSRSLDRLRSRASRPAETLHENAEAQSQPHPASDPLESAVADERRSIVKHALEKLDPKYREVLECSFFEGLSHTEIALKLQKPVGTVKTYLRRGLIQLRDFLRNPDEEERKAPDEE